MLYYAQVGTIEMVIGNVILCPEDGTIEMVQYKHDISGTCH